MNHLGDRLHAYVDGELSPGPRAAVEAHLRDCPACRAQLEELRGLGVSLAQREVPDPGRAYWNEFATRVETRLPRRAAGRAAGGQAWLTGWLFAGERFAWGRALGAAAACTVLVYVGMRGYRGNPAQMALESRPPAATLQPQDAPAPTDAEEPRVVAPSPVPPAAEAGSTSGSETKALARRSTVRAKEAAPSSPVASEADRQPEENRALAAKGEAAPVVTRTEAAEEPAADRSVAQHLAPSPLGKGFGAESRDSGAPGAGLVAQLQTRQSVDAGEIPLPDSTAGVESWLALDATFWPQHTVPAIRPTLVRIASGLARHPEDSRAADRTRAYAIWLATTSPSDSERTYWEDLLQKLPPR